MRTHILSLLVLINSLTSVELYANEGNVSPYSRSTGVVVPVAKNINTIKIVDDAQRFISSRLHKNVLGELNFWLPDNIQLTTHKWSWKETQVSTDKKVLMSDYGEFEVNPVELVWPVVVDKNKVIFECAIDKCIYAKKSTLVKGIYTGEDIVNSDTKEKEAKHMWHFENKEEAMRVTNAMNLLLKSLGAAQNRF